MFFFKQFDVFDPITGDVPEYPFSYLPEIAGRARSILGGKTRLELVAAVKRIDQEIKSYFDDLKYVAVSDLKSKLQAEGNSLEPYFEWTGGDWDDGGGDECWKFNDNFEDDLEIPTAINCSEVDALKAIIEHRDSNFFLPEGAPEPEPDEYPEGKTFELFAVLALWLLSDALELTRNSGKHGMSIAGAYAVKAMDAVCYAEQVREVEWLGQFHKKQLLDASTSQMDQIADTVEKVRENLIAEHSAHERAKQTARSEQLNAARHQVTKRAREQVCKAWGQAIHEFSSAEQAGNHYANWLEKNLIGYVSKGEQKFYQPRAVTAWIRKHAKEKGIKFR